QDCECELDREWMKGPLLPARWDAGRQQQALQSLGFDPENPLVRAEVSRIVLRGPGTGQMKKLAGTASGLGYSEVLLDELPTNELPDLESAGVTAATEQVSNEPAPALAAANPLERTRLFTW